MNFLWLTPDVMQRFAGSLLHFIASNPARLAY